MSWDISDASEYVDILREPGDEWSDLTGRRMLSYWMQVVDDYAEADCDETILERYCNSLGQFGMGCDRICQWLESRGLDPQLLWEANLLIEYQLDGDGPGAKAISRSFDRTGLLLRRAHNSLSSPIPHFEPTPTDEKLLAIIDKHGFVKSQTDLLDKLSEAGEIMDQGTAKPRLAVMKANGTLLAWRGTRGYRRP